MYKVCRKKLYISVQEEVRKFSTGKLLAKPAGTTEAPVSTTKLALLAVHAVTEPVPTVNTHPANTDIMHLSETLLSLVDQVTKSSSEAERIVLVVPAVSMLSQSMVSHG